MSHLPDEVGWRGSARHNSTGKRGSLGTINHLHRTSEGGACLEATPPTDKVAPCSLGGYANSLTESPAPLITGAWVSRS
jgi:hypothetical protein